MSVGHRGLVGVDDNATAEVAEVVVERPPGLVGHGLDHSVLTRRQVEETSGAGAEDLRDRDQSRNQAVGDDEALVAPGFETIAQISVARQETLELLVRLAVGVARARARGGRRSSRSTSSAYEMRSPASTPA